MCVWGEQETLRHEGRSKMPEREKKGKEAAETPEEDNVLLRRVTSMLRVLM